MRRCPESGPGTGFSLRKEKEVREDIEKILGVRYTKITFTVQFMEDTIMPEQKASALRGGIGEMLLRANCIRDRKCGECDFESECMVQRTMYSKFDKKPGFITTGDSIGYVMECEDYRTAFEEGEYMEFSLLLFGKTIVYFNQYLQAIFSLGQHGVGKHKSRFQITAITNHRKQDILIDGNIFMQRYEVSTIRDYVLYRKKHLRNQNFRVQMIFRTPLTMKFRNEFIDSFVMEAIVSGITRRLYMMDCFEGIEVEQLRAENLDVPEILTQEVMLDRVKRYSNRQKMSMELYGIKGDAILASVEDTMMDLLLAGELIHIGKNTSFGFGKYVLI